MKPTPWFIGYANLNVAIDCRAADPFTYGPDPVSGTLSSLGSADRRASACAIYAGGTGTAVVRPPWGASDGSNDVTLALVAGMPPVKVNFDSVAAGGTATNVVIFWPRTQGE